MDRDESLIHAKHWIQILQLNIGIIEQYKNFMTIIHLTFLLCAENIISIPGINGYLRNRFSVDRHSTKAPKTIHLVKNDLA